MPFGLDPKGIGYSNKKLKNTGEIVGDIGCFALQFLFFSLFLHNFIKTKKDRASVFDCSDENLSFKEKWFGKKFDYYFQLVLSIIVMMVSISGTINCYLKMS